MGHLGRFTKTPYLVLFVILGAIGVTAVYAGEVDIGGIGGLPNPTITMAGDAHVAAGKSLFVDTIQPESDFFVNIPSDFNVEGFTGFGKTITIFQGLVNCINDQIGNSFDCLSGSMIVAETVTSNEIADDAVGESELATDSVGSDEIKSNAIGSAEIADGQVMTDDLADDAVTGSKIAGTSKLIFGSCTLTTPNSIDSGITFFESCAEVGVEVGDKILANHSDLSCMMLGEAISVTPDEIRFRMLNVCSGTVGSGTSIPVNYIVYDDT